MTIPRDPAFIASEYQTRIGGVQRAMKEGNLDGLVLFDSCNVNYLCGMDTENQFDYQCLIVPQSGEPTLVLLDFELSRFENSVSGCRPNTYSAQDDPVVATWQTIRGAGLMTGRIAIETRSTLPAATFSRLESGMTGAERVNGFGIVERLRLVKSDAELALMRRAAELTDLAIEAGRAAIHAGVADSEIAGEICRAIYAAGGDTMCWGPIVAAGYRSGCAHSTFSGYRLRPGDAVFFELTGQQRRYVAPVMRTSILGKPTAAQQSIALAVEATIEAIRVTAKAGVSARTVAAAALKELTPLLPGMIFHYTFGYPVGIGFPPSWIERLGFFIRDDNEELLQRGMVFHLPISLRKYGEYGINLSETIVVGNQRAEALSKNKAALHVA